MLGGRLVYGHELSVRVGDPVADADRSMLDGWLTVDAVHAALGVPRPVGRRRRR